jgi:hypothetical protein
MFKYVSLHILATSQACCVPRENENKTNGVEAWKCKMEGVYVGSEVGKTGATSSRSGAEFRHGLMGPEGISRRTPEQRSEDLRAGRIKGAQIARDRLVAQLDKECEGCQYDSVELAKSMSAADAISETIRRFGFGGMPYLPMSSKGIESHNRVIRLITALQRIDQKLENPESLIPKQNGGEGGETVQKAPAYDGPMGIYGAGGRETERKFPNGGFLGL